MKHADYFAALYARVRRLLAREPSRRYRVGALGFPKGRSPVYAFNRTTENIRVFGAHAERRLLAKAPDCEVILVARITREGRVAPSRPCSACETYLMHTRVRWVYYAIGEKEYGVWNTDQGRP